MFLLTRRLVMRPESQRGVCWMILIAALLASTGCATTKKARTVDTSGFLGDYSQLQKGGEGMPLLYYGNPSADCRNYDKVIIDPMALWATSVDSPLASLNSEDRRMLVTMGTHTLHDIAIHSGFQVVNSPGRGVMRVRAAFTEADQANVPLKEVSIVAPYVSGAAAVWSEYQGQAEFTGAAAIELELLDSRTGERLYAMVDKRVGKMDPRNYQRWDDVKAAVAAWREGGIRRLTTCHTSGSFVPKPRELSLEQQIEQYQP